MEKKKKKKKKKTRSGGSPSKHLIGLLSPDRSDTYIEVDFKLHNYLTIPSCGLGQNFFTTGSPHPTPPLPFII